MSERIAILTTAPIFQNIMAQYVGNDQTHGYPIRLKNNEEIVIGKELDLEASPKVIPKSVIDGPTGWEKRGLIRKAKFVKKEVVQEIETEDNGGKSSSELVSQLTGGSEPKKTGETETSVEFDQERYDELKTLYDAEKIEDEDLKEFMTLEAQKP